MNSCAPSDCMHSVSFISEQIMHCNRLCEEKNDLIDLLKSITDLFISMSDRLNEHTDVGVIVDLLHVVQGCFNIMYKAMTQVAPHEVHDFVAFTQELGDTRERSAMMSKASQSLRIFAMLMYAVTECVLSEYREVAVAKLTAAAVVCRFFFRCCKQLHACFH